MVSISSNKAIFHFACTNYGSNKDGIGHFTYKIVNELCKNELIKLKTYHSKTHQLSKLELFFSFRMSLKLLKLKKELNRNKNEKNYIILEYPFVEYNPVILLVLCFIKFTKSNKTKLVVSLHEYARTKLLRKLFIRILISISDIVLFTKDEDVQPFIDKKHIFIKRIIPANIEPLDRKIFRPIEAINICFFGIINFKTKEITNMIKGWEIFCNENLSNRINFHFITSSSNKEVSDNELFTYHYNLKDEAVSKLLKNMNFMILPLKPKISINNGSLAVCCIHECLPVGLFDNKHFDTNFGVEMNNYSEEEFYRIYELINKFNLDDVKKKSKISYEYGKKKSVTQSANYYSKLIELE